MSIPNGNWNYPTTIWFGNGRIAELPRACNESGVVKPLFVTDRALLELDIVAGSLSLLREAGIEHAVFSGVQGNPTAHNVREGIAAYREASCGGIIAFGGGSAIDVGKAIALMAGQDCTLELWDMEDVDDNWRRADEDGICPIVAVPTTAGTGSETGRAAVITDVESATKKIIFHPRMLPTIIISDPQLTLGLPRTITAWTGMDALVHAIEAYCAPGYHPMADGIAVEAICMIARNLPLAVRDGNNLDARGHMLVAASMGATAFQKGLGSIHSIAHQLGALFDLQHGLCNAILLPYGLRQNRRAIQQRMRHLCRVLELPGDDTQAVIDFVLRLRAELGIPHTLAQVDVDESRAELIGRMAFKDPSTATNARSVSAADLTALFVAAVRGELDKL
jgi:alcohol dehydrogenase class IV